MPIICQVSSTLSSSSKMPGHLQIPEVVRSICNELDRSSALAMSLTCRAFFEPGLDSLWHSLDSFEPLLACLPADLWRIEQKNIRDRNTLTSVHCLKRALVPADVDRYLTRYAPRIRRLKADIYKAKRVPSLELLQALQVVTDFQPGALAPLLRSFRWIPGDMIKLEFGLEYSNNIQPFMPLFVGASVTNLMFNMKSSLRLHALTLLATAKRLPYLETLVLGSETVQFADDYLRSSPWNHLKHLEIKTFLPSAIPYMASIPQLTRLFITSLEEIPRRYPNDSGATGRQIPLPIQGFSCLKVLSIKAATCSTIIGFFQHLPTLTKLQELIAFALARCSSEREAQDTIDAIAERLNPNIFWDLQLCDSVGNVPDYAPKEDSEYRPPITIAPFYIFKRLKFITVGFSHWISITPDDIARMRTAWTKIETMDIVETCPIEPAPLIDHTHLLHLLDGCPSLKTVGLRFDATRVSGKETGGPFNLGVLIVSGSTISSPTSVLKFIRANLPHLKSLDATFLGVDFEHVQNMYTTRWRAVVDALGGGT
ncbi:hypothetical protein DFP72DRAFT_959293 [Ephemerocybe angulata]|uniref:F-box domain-containing protein n=1 Tax=Ephemerocybe angulata TaxID=980116 RepID=A0A8H6ICL7_9AGAR|nr:hypothetical protein DFP72DRAFT_959293 [Tulosesus angulatus]